MSATTTMRAVLAPGEQYDAGLYRAVERDGVLYLALSADRRRRHVSRLDAMRASGRKRWCLAAKYELHKMIADERLAARREVERALGADYDDTICVVVSGGDVCATDGAVIATLDR
mgnify:CR=1 FL=1